MGYKFQFITLAGFHQLNFGMFELARGYKERQMAAYSRAPGSRVRFRGERLHGDQAPARGRHRLFRRGVAGDHRRQVVDHRHEGIDRDGTVPSRGRVERIQPEETTMTPVTRVKERAEEQSSAMSGDQQSAIRMLAQRSAPAEPSPS